MYDLHSHPKTTFMEIPRRLFLNKGIEKCISEVRTDVLKIFCGCSPL